MFSQEELNLIEIILKDRFAQHALEGRAGQKQHLEFHEDLNVKLSRLEFIIERISPNTTKEVDKLLSKDTGEQPELLGQDDGGV